MGLVEARNDWTVPQVYHDGWISMAVYYRPVASCDSITFYHRIAASYRPSVALCSRSIASSNTDSLPTDLPSSCSALESEGVISTQMTPLSCVLSL